MVRRLVIALCAFLGVNAFADAILWRVSDDQYSGSFTAARVMVTPTGDSENRSDAVVLTVVDVDPVTGEVISFSDGMGLVNTDYTPGTTGDIWSEIPVEYIDSQTALFFIELGNYAQNGDEYAWTGTVAYGRMVTYGDLRDMQVLGKPGEIGTVHTWWTDTPYTPVPEPTSGILALVGFGLLALKRKKAG